MTAVVRDRGNRPEAPRQRPSASEVRAQLGDERTSIGDDAIAYALDAWVAGGDKPSFVLFGSLHDSGEQVDELRRLVVRMPHLWAVVMEQFKTKGAWLGAPPVADADVDDDALAELFSTGSEGAAYRLREAQLGHDYAAWKFDYVPRVLDVAVALRGTGKAVYACDMPKKLLDPSLEGTPDAITLREAHCAIAAREKLRLLGPAHVAPGETYVDDVPPPMRAAFFVGDDHAGIGGIARFLHESARIATVHMVGGRPVPDLADGLFAGSIDDDLLVDDPVLVPSQNTKVTEWTLLLPNTSGGDPRIDRAIDEDAAIGRPSGDSTISAPTVFVQSDEPIHVAIAGSDVAVSKAGEWLRVRPGVHACVLRNEKGTPDAKTKLPKTVVFALDVPSRGVTRVMIDAVGVRVRRSP